MCNLDKLSARFGQTIQTVRGADCGKASCKHSSNYKPPPKAAPPKRPKRAKRAKRAQKPGGPGPAAKTIESPRSKNTLLR
ncbi:hypothetical protein E4U57_002148 [Claviceps arundinis]|uniref:Histone H1 n=1 Tax=Claviceps arundinis TaxID=1623583 RepID=A0ABQ7P908_9HYPO|nr:hypothetical protein E4U57_002148 [Claviceps arundinis]